MMGYRIETESPFVDLRLGATINKRIAEWAEAAHRLLSDEIARDRDMNGIGEEVSLLLTNRQADHLAMGLSIIGAHMRRAA